MRTPDRPTNWEVIERAVNGMTRLDNSLRGRSPAELEKPSDELGKEFVQMMYPIAYNLLIAMQRYGVDLVGKLSEDGLIENNVTSAQEFEARRQRKI